MTKLGNGRHSWPRGMTSWVEGRTLYISVCFTWDIPAVNRIARQIDFTYDRTIVGGPAVKLMPQELSRRLIIGQDYPGALQKVNPLATFTSRGCVRACGFCAVSKTEGVLVELPDWPDRPIICDNNLLACSITHFDKVIERLKKHSWCDFNQGLDARLLTPYHAERFRELNRPMLRLALDDMKTSGAFLSALETLLEAKIPKAYIRAYALVGFNTDPSEAWKRCEFIESWGIKALPMWYHPLDALKRNQVTERQKELGWTDYERRRIMQFWYQHKRAKA